MVLWSKYPNAPLVHSVFFDQNKSTFTLAKQTTNKPILLIINPLDDAGLLFYIETVFILIILK